METDRLALEQLRERQKHFFREIRATMWERLTPKQREFLSRPELTEEHGQYVFKQNGSKAYLSPRGENISLTMIQTEEAQRGQGHASNLLRRICEMADEVGVTLSLMAEPKARKIGLVQSQLVKWYRRHGFKGECDKMIRPPSRDAG